MDILAAAVLILMTVLVAEAARPDFYGMLTMAVLDAFIIWRIFV